MDFAVADKVVECEDCVERRRVVDSDLEREGRGWGPLSEDLRRLELVAVLGELEEVELRRVESELEFD